MKEQWFVTKPEILSYAKTGIVCMGRVIEEYTHRVNEGETEKRKRET